MVRRANGTGPDCENAGVSTTGEISNADAFAIRLLRAIRILTLSLLAILLCTHAFWTGPASAQSAGEPENGQTLAQKLCVNCHQVTPEQTGPLNPDVPSFHEIAVRPGQTAERIAGAIVVPHPPMPQIALPRRDIADLAAYILSLKP